MTGGLPALKPKAVIRALERGGFFVHHTTGSHYILRHPTDQRLRITIAYHNKDMKPKTLRSVIRQAGLTTDEFLDLL